MRSLHADRLHEGGDVVGEQLHRIGAVRLVSLARASRVNGDASEMLGIVCDLEGIAGVVGGEIGDEDERLSCPLLLVVHGDAVRFDLRHVNLSLRMSDAEDRKSTRLNSSHGSISYAVFCLKKKKKKNRSLLIFNKITNEVSM